MTTVHEDIPVNRTKNGDLLFVEQSDFPSIIVITCYLTMFSLVGTTGNAFVLYVFSRKKDKSTSTVFILALAATDFFTCLLIIPFTIVVEFMGKRVYSDSACKLYQFLITSNVPFSAFIMVAIAFDRYFCICRPWLKIIDIRIAKRIIICLFFFAISLGLITCLAHGVYHYLDSYVPFWSLNHGLNYTSKANGSISTFSTQNILSDPSFSGKIGRTEMTSDNMVRITRLVPTGFCYPNEVIIGEDVRKIYQKFYVSLFLIAFITVFVLYALIYKSILSRRSKRLRSSVTYRHLNGRRSTLLTSVITKQTNCHEKSTLAAESQTNVNHETKSNYSEARTSQTSLMDNLSPNNTTKESPTKENTEQDNNILNQINNTSATPVVKNNLCPNSPSRPRHTRNSGSKNPKNRTRFKEKYQQIIVTNEHIPMIAEHLYQNGEPDVNQITTITIHRQDTRKSVREKTRIANIKTAGILFIVTIVFIVAFLPCWLMAIRLIPPNMIVFYMYFSYNVANPVIYAFFNHAFQKEVRGMLKCRFKKERCK